MNAPDRVGAPSSGPPQSPGHSFLTALITLCQQSLFYYLKLTAQEPNLPSNRFKVNDVIYFKSQHINLSRRIGRPGKAEPLSPPATIGRAGGICPPFRWVPSLHIAKVPTSPSSSYPRPVSFISITCLNIVDIWGCDLLLCFHNPMAPLRPCTF